jgi:hypothetical protein
VGWDEIEFGWFLRGDVTRWDHVSETIRGEMG